MSIARTYSKEMHDRYGYWAAWLPNVQMKLGAVGRLSPGDFQDIDSLDALGIAFETEVTPANLNFDYTSRGGVDIDFGATPGVGEATEARIRFESDHAILFAARGCRVHKIKNVGSLNQALVERAQIGAWRFDYAIVTEVVEAESATILIAENRGAQITLVGSMATSPGCLALAPSGGLGFRSASGIATQIVASGGLTPLFAVQQLKRRMFREPMLTKRSTRAERPEGMDHAIAGPPISGEETEFGLEPVEFRDFEK